MMNSANRKGYYLAIAWLIGLVHCATATPVRLNAGAPQPAIEDPTGQAMQSFYDALTRTERGFSSVRIAHYGDSHVAADLLTGTLRRDLQRCFGDGGTGFVLASKPYSYYARPGVTIEASSGWRVNGLSEASLIDDGRFGLAGISFTARAAGESVRISAPCRFFDLYLLKQPGGGAVTIRLDGLAYERDLSLAAAHDEAIFMGVGTETEAVHTLEVTVTRPGAVRVLGVDVARGGAGLIYDVLGINGARMSRMFEWDWQILESNFVRSNPDLIILAYGSNEAGDADLDPDEYGASFSALLARLHEAAPRASLLVVAPPDRAIKAGSRWQTIRRLPELVAAERRAARQAGAAFFDMFHAMGGAGSIARWATARPALAQPDRVHLTATGYRLVAGWLYEALMRGWRDSQLSAPANRSDR